MDKVRVAVVGAGAFGQNHLRVLQELPDATIAAVVDADQGRAQATAAQYGCPAYASPSELAERVDAAVVAVPTTSHAEVGCALLNAGIDVLIEKPIAPNLGEAHVLVQAAERSARVLAVGHLERFNPAVQALSRAVSIPLFFEIHRMSVYSPRSLDGDVVLDLMIHDVDILLSLVDAPLQEVRAAGISILSPREDIANVRLAFANGCVANLTASRVSTEKIRKLRLFQPGEYLSLDYQRQDVMRIEVRGKEDFYLGELPVEKDEPLRLELVSFLRDVRERRRPVVDGEAATRALEVCLSILATIGEHASIVADTLQRATAQPSSTS